MLCAPHTTLPACLPGLLLLPLHLPTVMSGVNSASQELHLRSPLIDCAAWLLLLLLPLLLPRLLTAGCLLASCCLRLSLHVCLM